MTWDSGVIMTSLYVGRFLSIGSTEKELAKMVENSASYARFFSGTNPYKIDKNTRSRVHFSSVYASPTVLPSIRL